jgi:hypothetical protein
MSARHCHGEEDAEQAEDQEMVCYREHKIEHRTISLGLRLERPLRRILPSHADA